MNAIETPSNYHPGVHPQSGFAGTPTGDGIDLASLQFREFFDALMHAVHAAVRTSDSNGKAAAESLSRQLCQLIELQSLDAGRIGGKSGADVEVQGRFLKAVLADEILLNMDWPGRAYWQHVLIEATLFRTAHAGERVFDDIDQLLREREASRRNVGRLYLHLLSLGFQGRYQGSQQQAKIAEYRRELFQYVYLRPADLSGRDRTLSEQPYASTLSHLTARRLPKLNRRGLIILIVGLVIAGFSEMLWLWQTWPVRNALTTTVSQAAPVMQPELPLHSLISS